MPEVGEGLVINSTATELVQPCLARTILESGLVKADSRWRTPSVRNRTTSTSSVMKRWRLTVSMDTVGDSGREEWSPRVNTKFSLGVENEQADAGINGHPNLARCWRVFPSGVGLDSPSRDTPTGFLRDSAGQLRRGGRLVG